MANNKQHKPYEKYEKKDIDTSNICIGNIYKYPDLCKILNEPKLKGNKQTGQLKYWACFFKFEQTGKEFLIQEIYPTPQEEQHQTREKPTKYAEKIAYMCLLSTYPIIGKTIYLLQLFGFVSEDYTYAHKKFSKGEFINNYILNSFFEYCSEHLSRVLSDCIKSLRKMEFTIDTNYLVIDTIEEGDEFTENAEKYPQARYPEWEEKNFIEKVQQNLLTKFNCKDIPEIHWKHKALAFYSRLNKGISSLSIKYVGKEYSISNYFSRYLNSLIESYNKWKKVTANINPHEIDYDTMSNLIIPLYICYDSCINNKNFYILEKSKSQTAIKQYINNLRLKINSDIIKNLKRYVERQVKIFIDTQLDDPTTFIPDEKLSKKEIKEKKKKEKAIEYKINIINTLKTQNSDITEEEYSGTYRSLLNSYIDEYIKIKSNIINFKEINDYHFLYEIQKILDEFPITNYLDLSDYANGLYDGGN